MNRTHAIVHAITQVLDEYFNRAPESTKMEFITMKGFDLLSLQVSHQILSHNFDQSNYIAEQVHNVIRANDSITINSARRQD